MLVAEPVEPPTSVTPELLAAAVIPGTSLVPALLDQLSANGLPALLNTGVLVSSIAITAGVAVLWLTIVPVV